MRRRDFVFRTGLATGGLMSGLRCGDIVIGAGPESPPETRSKKLADIATLFATRTEG